MDAWCVDAAALAATLAAEACVHWRRLPDGGMVVVTGRGVRRWFTREEVQTALQSKAQPAERLPVKRIKKT